MYGAQVSKAEFENFALKNFGKELVCLKLFSVRVKSQLGNGGNGTECRMVNPASIRFTGKYLVWVFWIIGYCYLVVEHMSTS